MILGQPEALCIGTGNRGTRKVARPAEGVPRQAMDVHYAPVAVVVTSDVAVFWGRGLWAKRVGVWV